MLLLSKQHNLKVQGSLKFNSLKITTIQLWSKMLVNSHHMVTLFFKWHLSPFATDPFNYDQTY